MYVAVVLPAFDIAPFLRQALLSMLSQTHPDWSLVVVDDGSTDATAAIAASFTDPRIRMIQQANAGVSAARNRGIAAFRTHRTAPPPDIREFDPAIVSGCPVRGDPHPIPDAFLFLDGDDWLAPDALARLTDALDAAPWAVAAIGRYARVAADGVVRLSSPPPKGCLLELLLTRNLFANGGHLLIRREAVEFAGPFRQDLRYGEDWEYWVRVALLGEFVAVRSRAPLLFVRERHAGAYLSNASDATAYRPAMDAIYANPAVAGRLGSARMACLWRSAEAELAWAVGRELIRHGHRRIGRIWLGRSVRHAPSLRRLALMAMSWLRAGPFRPYRVAE